MLEFIEAAEIVLEDVEYENLSHQIEELTQNYNEAVLGGYEDVARNYQEKIEQIKEWLGKKEQPPPPTAITGHQGAELSQVLDTDTPDELKQELSESRKEISFGSSDIKTLEDRVAKWSRDVQFHSKQLESTTRKGLDTSKNKSDLKSAEQQYKTALRELNRARDKQ